MSERTEERISTADLTGSATDAEERDPDGTLEARDTNQPLLPAEDGDVFQDRWQKIQVAFVDEPQASVRDADALVAELMQTLAGTFADERARLEGEWERGAEVSTEDLRQALQHYRSFFQRLLAA
jgi:hypothetical protein